jgi:proteasome lid subunit RPN8/RPN11
MNTQQIEREIRFEARRNTAEERCGVLAMQNKGLRVVALPNVAVDKAHFFELDRQAYLYHLRIGNTWGVWHTHPKGDSGFSEADIAVGDAVGLNQVLYELEPDKFTYRTPPTYKPWPLVGRPFCLGLYDCWAFGSDFYKRFYDLEISDFDRSILNKAGAHPNPATLWEANGFRHVYQPRVGRLVLLSIRAQGLINHLGVLPRIDLIGHHFVYQSSIVEIFNTDFWRMSTHGFMTHDAIEADDREELIL